MRRELYGITRRKASGINPGAVLSGGSAGIGGGSTPGTPGVGDNLGNHIATMQLNMAQWLQTNYVGWTGVTLGQRDYVDVTGVSHFLPNAESYKWFIDSELLPLCELTEFGQIYNLMYYGVDFQDNYISFTERPKPGNPQAIEKIVYMDGGTHLLSVVQSDGNIVPLEQEFITINYVIDGGGSVITTGKKGGLWVHFNCEVVSWVISDDSYSGSATVKVTYSRYANFPTQFGMSTITSHPNLSGAQKNTAVATGQWSRTLIDGQDQAEGVYIGFNVSAATSVRRLTVGLKCRRIT